MQKYKFLPVFLISILLPMSASAGGQSVPINYDSLSFLEEPLAVKIGPATLNANMLVDQAAQYNSSLDEDTYNTRVNGRVALQAQLPNGWKVRANYVANYSRLADDEYTDNAALSVSDEWGTLAGGNVTGSVREKTRRARGAGNAVLANDNFLGGLDEAGGFYSVRYNSYEVSVTADQEGRAEAGLSFERPIGKSNYFVATRVRKGDTTDNSRAGGDGDSLGAGLVAEYTYASVLVDGQIGYENIELNNTDDHNDHVFGSVGAQYKSGAYSFSAEGGLGRYNGDDRRAFALGARVDVARGASVNFGVNYTYSNDRDSTTGLTSLRYEF